MRLETIGVYELKDIVNLRNVPLPCENPEEVIKEKLGKNEEEEIIISLILDGKIYTFLYTVKNTIKCIMENLKYHSNIICIIESRAYNFYRA